MAGRRWVMLMLVVYLCCGTATARGVNNRGHRIPAVHMRLSQDRELVGCFLSFGLCSVLRPRQHSIGYMGDGCHRSLLQLI